MTDREKSLALLHMMLRIRRLEESAAELYGKGIVRGFLHLYNGQEAIAAGVLPHLQPTDRLWCTYREHGHALARGMTASTILSELAGKREGCCGGRGGSMHLFDVKLNFYGGTAIVGAHLPMAVGMAMADQKSNRNSITACFLGEGAAAEGVFHESMNLATLWKVPVLFILENNRYAMGTALTESQTSTDFSRRVAAYGLSATEVNGMDVEEVWMKTKSLTESMRSQPGPGFLICNTYRFRAHSMFDAEHYRSKEEVNEWKKKDPIITWRQRLVEQGWLDDLTWQQLQAAVDKEMKEASEAAAAGTTESPETLEKHLYGNG